MGYIYLYGMILSSQSIKLISDFPKPDNYCEVERRYYGVGGETGTAAVILASLGCQLKLAGSHLGYRNNQMIRDYFANYNADLSELVYDENFYGVEDLIIIDKSTRTAFGEFGRLYSTGLDWVEKPLEESVKNCDIVGCDPYFGNEIMELCVKFGKKYVVIDSPHDSYANLNCAVHIISHEFLREKYPGKDQGDIYKLYTESTNGLVIITQGERELMYGRKGQSPCCFSPYPVIVQSTLGAGDSFKAGTIYGLSKGFDDDRLVEFATATAAYSCSHYPIPESPATLEGVNAIIHKKY